MTNKTKKKNILPEKIKISTPTKTRKQSNHISNQVMDYIIPNLQIATYFICYPTYPEFGNIIRSYKNKNETFVVMEYKDFTLSVPIEKLVKSIEEKCILELNKSDIEKYITSERTK